jgi:hypothetical protein
MTEFEKLLAENAALTTDNEKLRNELSDETEASCEGWAKAYNAQTENAALTALLLKFAKVIKLLVDTGRRWDGYTLDYKDACEVITERTNTTDSKA